MFGIFRCIMESLNATTIVKRREKNLAKCILCQQSKKKNESVLTTTPAGVEKIIDASNKLNDGLLDGLTKDQRKDIKYHRTNCYGPYVLKGSRVCKDAVSTPPIDEETSTMASLEIDVTEQPRSTRSASLASPVAKDLTQKPCEICHQMKYKGDTSRFRVSEHQRATRFLAALKFNKDDVHRRLIFCESVGDIFAADVMYHKNCMSGYLLSFERDFHRIQEISEELDKESDDVLKEAVDKLCSTLELKTKGYALSYCRDSINKSLEKDDKKLTISNRRLKEYLIKKYGVEVGFSSAYKSSESEMFFSTDIDQDEMVKKIRSSDVISECATMLGMESRKYNFLLDSSYCDANDISLSHTIFTSGRPPLWNKFTHSFFSKSELSSDKQRASDTVFQILHKAINNNQKRTPLSIGLAETISDLTRSKHLNVITNRLGLSASYDEVERVDTGIIERTIDSVPNDHRVPVPPHIDDETIIHGAMDNFDHKDNHDSILMLFQNACDEVSRDCVLSNREGSTSKRARKLPCALPCQNLIEVHRGNQRGVIPLNYVSAVQEIFESVTQFDFESWCFIRYVGSKISKYLSSFSSINSILSEEVVTKTRIGFTPILPHPITDFESVYTVMCNFQDVLSQKNQICGPLWCDEGVYQLAKEIQLLHPDKFDNIFLGMGGFHTEKVILACCGKLLETIGARDIFINSEIYGPVVTDNKVLKGKDYVLCREAMRNFTEAVNRVKIEKFMQGRDGNLSRLKDLVQELHGCFQFSGETEEVLPDRIEAFKSKWMEIKDYLEHNLYEDYCAFKVSNEEISDMWKFFNKVWDKVMHVMTNLTRSFREGNWLLHLQAISQALDIIFNCHRIHYCRYLPLYYQDCLNLQVKHPTLYQSFCAGDFVVHHTTRKYSGMPMDQALEKEYNKKAKDAGGIIGITRREESVAKWNLIKHEKGAFTKFIDDMVDYTHSDEYSLHHEFSHTVTKNDHKDVEAMSEYISNNCDLLKPGQLTNISTGVHLSAETSHFLLDCFATGETLHQEYRQVRLIERSLGLYDTISDPHSKVKKKKSEGGKANLEKMTNLFTRNVEIARARCFDVKTLFAFEGTDKSYFLSPDGLFLSKGNKSELQPLLKTKSIPSNDVEYNMEKSILVIDFMAEARKIGSRRKKFNLKTFGDVIDDLWLRVLHMGRQVSRIDIVFDCYRNDSVKALERHRRSLTSDAARITVSNMKQPLPPAKEFERFWSLSANKISLEQFFITWVMDNYDGEKPIYLGGCHLNDIDRCYKLANGDVTDIPALKCSYDEADDRIMFHLNHAVMTEHFSFAHVASSDTDIFVSLMYHHLNWRLYGLQELWMHHNGSASPLHDSVGCLPIEVVRILPAIHALTGCDTTAKVGTKLQAFNAAKKQEHFKLAEFGLRSLDEEMIQSAENFLLDCMSRTATRSAETFDELRYNRYHTRSPSWTIDKIPCSSEALLKQINWAYFQCNLWTCAANRSSCSINPINFQYTLDDDGFLTPNISIETPIPDNFPQPCTCGKCARETVCNCRVLQINCCEFCKCKSDECKNPY